MCVSSALYAVGLSPKFDWSKVVSCGRVGPALRPILVFSLFQYTAVSEFDGAICQLSLTSLSSSVVLSEKLLIVSRLILGLEYAPHTHSLSFTIGPPTS